jgi:hypothetical protein
MKTTITALSLIILAFAVIFTANVPQTGASDRAGCKAYIYIANNSLFDCYLRVDDFDVGTLMVGKVKIYEVELLNDEPRKIKVKVLWNDPDYIERRSYFLVTRNKLECGQTDSMYIAHTK